MKKRQGVISAIAGGAILFGALTVGVVTFAPLMGMGAATPSSSEEPATPTPTVTATPTVTPTPTPAPVVEPAPEPVAEEPAPAPDYGTPIPWIADQNPNNAEKGYWDTTQCPSSAGYTAPDGNQYCAP